MCFTSKNCYKTGNFSCVLKQKDPDFLKRFSAIWFFLITQIGAFFLIVAESFNSAGEETHVPVIGSGHSSGRAGRK